MLQGFGLELAAYVIGLVSVLMVVRVTLQAENDAVGEEPISIPRVEYIDLLKPARANLTALLPFL